MSALDGLTTVPPGGRLRWGFLQNVLRYFECFVEYATGSEIWHLRTDDSNDKKGIQIEARADSSAKYALVEVDSGGGTGGGTTFPKVILKAVSGASTGLVTLGATQLTIAVGTNIQNGLEVTGGATLDNTLTFTPATSKVIPGATSLSLRNNADSADNLLVTDAGGVTVRNGLTVSAGSITTPLTASRFVKTDGSSVLTVSGASTIALGSEVSGTLPVANGGTNNSSAYTTGSVVYFDGTKLTEANSGLYYDASNKRLGVGVASPTYQLQVNGSSPNLALSGTEGSGVTFRLLEQAGTLFIDNPADTTNTRIQLASGSLFPGTDNTLSCGKSGQRWSAVWAANGTIQTSSKAAKEQIERLDPATALAVVRNTDVYTYRLIGYDRPHVGFLAEDVDPLLSPDHETASPQTTASVALAAIRALCDRVETLERQVAALTSPA